MVAGCLANLHEDLRSKGAPYWFPVAYVPCVKTRQVSQFLDKHVFQPKDPKTGFHVYPNVTEETVQREILDQVMIHVVCSFQSYVACNLPLLTCQ
jgi:hypothetical protein